MGIELDKDYTIRNQAGLETQVNGRTLIERALANEPDTLDGQPIREFVRSQVDVEDSVAKAHEQGVAQPVLSLPSKEAERERISAIRQLEIELAAGVASANAEDDNLQEEGGDALDNRDLNADGIPDRLQPDNERVEAVERASARGDEEQE